MLETGVISCRRSHQFNAYSLSFRQSCNPLEGGSPTYCNQLVANPFYGLTQFAGTSLGSSPTVSRATLALPFPEFGTVTQYGRNDGKLWYNSLQLNYLLRATNDWDLSVAYTWSKSMEQGGSGGNGSSEAFIDVQRLVPERGLSNYDRAHVMKLSSVYQLPFGKGKPVLGGASRFLDALVGGWEHTLIFQYQTGNPWSLPANVLYVRSAGLDPDWKASIIQGVNPCVARVADNGTIALQPFSVNVPGCSLSTYNFLYFPSYAVGPGTTTQGRGGSLRAPDIRIRSIPDTDMSLMKTFRFSERTSFQFRAEAFNAFNRHIVTSSFTNNANSSTFGQIVNGSSGKPPRYIQLGFKFIF